MATTSTTTRRSLAAGLAAIEDLICCDPPTGRPVAVLRAPGDSPLRGAAEALLGAAAKGDGVALLTGFPCVAAHDPPSENDGLSGCLAVCRALLCVGAKRVDILTDNVNADVLNTGLEHMLEADSRAAPSWRDAVTLHAFPSPDQGWDDSHAAQLESIRKASPVWLAIERAGRAADGNYYTMKARSMNAIIAPLDDAYAAAPVTIGIGDGGNELGMGTVLDAVKKHVPLGETIACTTSSMFCLSCGVSNWGGMGLAAAMEILAPASPRVSFLPSEAEEGALSDAMAAKGARDGITGVAGRSVDGIAFEFHVGLLKDMQDIVDSCAQDDPSS